MALVAYDCSDESDNECDEEIVESKSIIKEINNSDNVKKFNDSKLNSISDDEEEIVPSSSKSFLPTPHSIIEDVEGKSICVLAIINLNSIESLL